MCVAFTDSTILRNKSVRHKLKKSGRLHPSPPCLHSTTAVQSRKCRLATLRRSRGGSTAVKCVTGREKLLKTTGGVTTVMAVLIKNRSGTAPPV